MTDNELIAEFMGVSVAFHGPVLYHSDEDGFIDFKGGAEPYWPDKDWNELMPVVVKCHEIAVIKCREYPEGKDLDDPTGWRSWSYRRVGLSTNIKQVYENVVEFIKWYNQNK